VCCAAARALASPLTTASPIWRSRCRYAPSRVAARAARTGLQVCEADRQHLRARRLEKDGAWRSRARADTLLSHRTLKRCSCGSDAAQKNPAFKGSVLYTVFEARAALAPCARLRTLRLRPNTLARAAQVQAYLSIFVGGLLAFNLIWPTDEPSIPRLIVRHSAMAALRMRRFVLR
jgi:hypothetical protein